MIFSNNFNFHLIIHQTHGRLPLRRHLRNDIMYPHHHSVRLRKMKDFLKQEQADILKKIQEQSEYIFSISTSSPIQKKLKVATTTSIKCRKAMPFSKEPARISSIPIFHFWPKMTSYRFKANSK